MNWSSNWNSQPLQEIKPPVEQQPVLNEPIPEEIQNILKVQNLPVDANGVLMLWQNAKNALTEAKNFEMDIRKLAVKVFVPKPEEGTNTVELGGGFKLKAVVKYNYKLLDNDIVDKTLQEIAKIGNEGAFIADRLVSWTPTFLLTEYRKLQEDAEAGSETAKSILKLTEKMLIIEDAAPTLDIKEPKDKK